MKDSKLRVAIIGGGIGGLALANALQYAGVDYVLIEKGEKLDPQIGASIGILPNGARILDQLGCLDDLAELTVGMKSTASHTADGSLIGDISDSLSLMEQRTGYAVFFLDRQLLLRTLARHIKQPDRVRLKTIANSIEQHNQKAVVTCDDGTTLEADIVVGADGVHSLVRREMWRHADLMGDGDKFAEDKKAMSAEYKCLFGISDSIAGMQPGQTDRTYARGVSTLSYVGKGGRVFWFVFIKMDQVYYPPHIPKFTKADTEDAIKQIGDLALREDGKVTVADVYNSRICCNLVAIEEAAYHHWSYGRLVCLGDSIHKMTPNLGAGASSAIESAAVLANFIVQAASKTNKPTTAEICGRLHQYQEERALRVGRAMAMTNKLTRVQALQTTRDFVFTHYIAPRADDFMAEAFSSFVIGAPYVEYLPVPAKSLQGTMPFNPKQGWGYEELISARVSRAWPLTSTVLISLLSSFHLQNSLYHKTALQSYWSSLRTSSPSESIAVSRSLAFSVAADVTYGIWLLESTRLNNKATLAQIPIVFGLIWRLIGQETAISLYFLLLYIYSPIEKFRAADNRLTDVSYTCSVGMLIMLFGAVPKFLQYHRGFLGLDGNNAYADLVVPSRLLLLLPLSVIQYFIARFARHSTIRSDRIWAVRQDVRPIRWNILILAALTTFSWNIHLWGSLRQISFTTNSMYEIWTSLLGSHGIVFAWTVGLWLALAFRDLRNAGMIDTSWVKLGALGLTFLICLGPGSMLVMGWQLREEILINRRHRDAIVKPKA